MAKLNPDEILRIVKENQKNIKYDTKDWSIEMVLSKFNREIEELGITEINVPFYQREFVWNEKQISKLIETLVLGLPLPLIFLEQTEDAVLEIIDGSQRIRALDKFFSNQQKLSGLEILHDLNGLGFQDFPEALKRQLNNHSLRIIVLQHIDDEEKYEEIAHEIFNRLNTAGTPATNMEARKGANYGAFLELIYEDLSRQELFKQLAQFGPRYSIRQYQEEFIVKFFAFYELYKKDNKVKLNCSLKDYLERFIKEENEKCRKDNYRDVLKDRFNKSVKFIKESDIIDLKKYATRKKEKLLAIMLAVAVYLDESTVPKNESIDIWTEEFEKNASTASINSLNQNINVVLKALKG